MATGWPEASAWFRAGVCACPRVCHKQKARDRLLSCCEQIQNQPENSENLRGKEGQGPQNPHPKLQGTKEGDRERERGGVERERERQRGTGRERQVQRERARDRQTQRWGEKRRERDGGGGRQRRGRAQRELTLSLPLSCPPARSWPGEGQAGDRGGLGPLLLRGFGFWLGSGWEKGARMHLGSGFWGSCGRGPAQPAGGGEGGQVQVVGGVPLSGLGDAGRGGAQSRGSRP